MENLKKWVVEQMNQYQNSMGLQEKARLLTIIQELEKLETQAKNL